MRVSIVVGLAGILALTSVPAAASNCGATACSTRVAVKGNSIIPADNEFALRGDRFTAQFTDVGLQANGSRQVDLGFSVNFGFGDVSSLFVNENGLVSFGRALGGVSGAPITSGPSAAAGARSLQAFATGGNPFVPVTSLTDLGIPVIAPFYADLQQGSGAGDGRLGFGDVTVQYGFADPYADENGRYDGREARQAVRITWYGLDIAGQSLAASNGQVFAQLLLSADLNGLSNFEFRYGPLDKPGQAGFGSLAGFALGNGNDLEFGGPYVDGIPTFFEFQDGRYIGQGAVPEPQTWVQLLIGFALLGAALRGARRRYPGSASGFA